jgi:hypothetical protein
MKTFFFDKTRWVYANVMTNVICMGLLHAPIAHGLGGAHGKDLTPLQVATHTLSLWFFLGVLIVAQNKAWKRPVNLVTAPNLVALLGLVPLMFWTGYYTLYIPFDILFMYLSLGVVNGWMLKPYVKRPALWMGQMFLTGLSAAVAGIAAGFSCFAIYNKNLHGMPFDIALWTTVTLPAGFAYALVGRYFIRRHFETATAEAVLTPKLEVSYQ